MSRKLIKAVAIFFVGLLVLVCGTALVSVLPSSLKSVCVVAMFVSCIVAGGALGVVSKKLNRYVYLDSALFAEAKRGSLAARVAIYAHAAFFGSFFLWIYLSVNRVELW